MNSAWVKSLLRFLCAVAWRLSEVAMTFAIRFDPDMPPKSDGTGWTHARWSADTIDAQNRSRPVGGHGLN